MVQYASIINECLTCSLDCELKGKKGEITFGELDKAAKNCPYRIKLKSITEAFAQYKKEIQKTAEFLAKIVIPDATISYRSIIEPLIKEMNNIQQVFSHTIPTYYSLAELEIISKPMAPAPPCSLSENMINRLASCRKGKEYWKEYQQICKDILTYLFVPPLAEPLEEQRTRNGLERRDLIFHIPYDAGGFWDMIRLKYRANALIVDCKNLNEPISKDEVISTSQYLSEKRLGNFGLILSRFQPSASALKEVQKLWLEQEKMIVCIDDEELKKMIQLKENGNEPTKFLDKKIFDFLASL